MTAKVGSGYYSAACQVPYFSRRYAGFLAGRSAGTGAADREPLAPPQPRRRSSTAWRWSLRAMCPAYSNPRASLTILALAASMKTF